MKDLIKEIVRASLRSERRHNIMLRVVVAGTTPFEVHGFKLLTECDPADYDCVFGTGGLTALYDATLDGIEAVANFSHFLMQNDFLANAMIFVITDGRDNYSAASPNEVNKALVQAVQDDDLESLTAMLIGILGVANKTAIAYKEESGLLRRFKKDVGFTHYMELDLLNDHELANMTEYICNSIRAVNHALGSGCLPSLPI